MSYELWGVPGDVGGPRDWQGVLWTMGGPGDVGGSHGCLIDHRGSLGM